MSDCDHPHCQLESGKVHWMITCLGDNRYDDRYAIDCPTYTLSWADSKNDWTASRFAGNARLIEGTWEECMDFIDQIHYWRYNID